MHEQPDEPPERHVALTGYFARGKGSPILITVVLGEHEIVVGFRHSKADAIDRATKLAHRFDCDLIFYHEQVH